MIKLDSLLNWKENGLNVSQVLAFTLTPTQNDMVEFDGVDAIYEDENLNELFCDLGIEFIRIEGTDTAYLRETFERDEEEPTVLNVVAIDVENRHGSDVPETKIYFNLVEEANRFDLEVLDEYLASQKSEE